MTVDRYADLVDIGDVGRVGDDRSAGSIRTEGVASRRSNLHCRRIAIDYGSVVDNRRVIRSAAVCIRYRDNDAVAALLQIYAVGGEVAVAEQEVARRLPVHREYDLVAARDVRRARVNGRRAAVRCEWIS